MKMSSHTNLRYQPMSGMNWMSPSHTKPTRILRPQKPLYMPIIQSLRIAREQNARFPGFESDVHGLIIEQEGDAVSYKVEVLKA